MRPVLPTLRTTESKISQLAELRAQLSSTFSRIYPLHNSSDAYPTRREEQVQAGPVGKLREEKAVDMKRPSLSHRPKILLYLTTHLSQSHIEFLRYCWPTALSRSRVLRQADVLVFDTSSRNQGEEDKLLQSVFSPGMVNLTIIKAVKMAYKEARLGTNGKQGGATLAMKEAVKNEWFKGYDWVIRLNPMSSFAMIPGFLKQ